MAIQKHRLQKPLTLLQEHGTPWLLARLEICVFTHGGMTKLQAHADTLARRALDKRGWGAVEGNNI